MTKHTHSTYGTNHGSGEAMSEQEFNQLLISSVPDQYAIIVTEGKTVTIHPAEDQNEQPIQLPMKPEQRIAEAKAYLESITIAGIDDKKNYELVKAALRGVVKWRTGIENKRKEMKRVALDYGKAVDDEAKRLTALVLEVETPAKAKLDAIDKAAEEARKAEQLRRHTLLTQNGWQFTGTWYICGTQSLLPETVAAATEEQLAEYEATGKAELDRLEAERVRKEAEAKAAADEAKRVAAENARLAAEAEELRKKLAALEAAKQPEPVAPVAQAPQAEPDSEPVYTGPAPGTFTPPPFDTRSEKKSGFGFSHPAPVGEIEYPKVGSVTAFDYEKGFNDCRNQIISLFSDPNAPKRTKADWIEVFKSLNPQNNG